MPVPWRAPCLWRPLPASIAGRAGARPDHPIIRHRARLTANALDACPPLSKYSLDPLTYRPLSLGSDMKRRMFIATVGCAAVWPVVARAQVPVLPVIGVLGGAGNDADGQ